MYNDLFCSRLAQLRMKKNVSARDMSLSMGQSASYINGIENKNFFPSMSEFFYICEYFNVKPKEFFDDGIRDPEKLNAVIDDLKELSDEQLANVAAIVRDIKK
jgi:transcriptional regulator with XRE-family HTH domain